MLTGTQQHRNQTGYDM